VVICLERGADLHMAQLMPLPLTASCFSKIQIGFTFLVPAHPGSPGQRAFKRVCVCVLLFLVLLVMRQTDRQTAQRCYIREYWWWAGDGGVRSTRVDKPLHDVIVASAVNVLPWEQLITRQHQLRQTSVLHTDRHTDRQTTHVTQHLTSVSRSKCCQHVASRSAWRHSSTHRC